MAERGMKRSARFGGLLQLAVVAVLLLIWWTATRGGAINPFLLPSPSDVAGRLIDDAASGDLARVIVNTLWRAAAGFAIAVAICVPLGIAMARLPAVRWLFEPLVSVGFPTPKIAFLPIFILWFGVFDASKIVMVAFATSFVVLSATASGASAIDRYLVWSAQSLGAAPAAIFGEVVLPAALPQILTGLQIGLPVALVTTIGTEMLTGGVGVGGEMLRAGRYADSVGVYAGIVVAGTLGFVLVKSLELLRRHLLRWHPEVRNMLEG
jgi:ABC-type nitrate/sulfonate/bicarbonate transport system permease component